MCSYLAVLYIPLGDALTIIYSGPIFTMTFSYCFLRIRQGPWKIFFALILLTGVVLVICSARLPPCACSLACYSSNGIFQPQSTSRPPTVPAHTPAPACTPRCFGYRNHTPESPALPMQSPAVSRSRHLTMCGGVSVCASAIVPDIRCFGYRNLTLETSSPSSQSSAVASPGPAKCCARSTSPLCHAVI